MRRRVEKAANPGRAFVADGGVVRVASCVVSGIGSLGAGLIMKEGVTIRGINAAATLWCSAAVGPAPGRLIALLTKAYIR